MGLSAPGTSPYRVTLYRMQVPLLWERGGSAGPGKCVCFADISDLWEVSHASCGKPLGSRLSPSTFA